MRVIIQESATLVELVPLVAAVVDPDTPLECQPGTAVSRMLEHLFELTREEVPIPDPEWQDCYDPFWLERLSGDSLLLELRDLPWQSVKVLDRHGTVALLF